MRVLMFHKPRAVVVTRMDERGRRTIYDLLPEWVISEGWVPVGRLDRDSKGLLLLVDDGSLVERLGAPGAHQKVYEVWIRGRVTEDQIGLLQKGVPTSVGTLRCVSANVIRVVGPRTELRVILDEGKNRHIRRMFGALRDPQQGTPLKVMELKRIEFGPIRLDIPSGKWRFLTSQEMDMLMQDQRL